jgi:hypothetical protein
VKRSHVFLGALICLMFIGAVAALFMLEPPPGAREPLLILIGALSAAFGSVVAFWFGSSSGSAHKSDLLAASSPDPKAIGNIGAGGTD